MADSVYKVIELVGTSTESWEKAARTAVERASQSLRDLRIAEVAELDMQITNGKVEAYRASCMVQQRRPSKSGRPSDIPFFLPFDLLDFRLWRFFSGLL